MSLSSWSSAHYVVELARLTYNKEKRLGERSIAIKSDVSYEWDLVSQEADNKMHLLEAVGPDLEKLAMYVSCVYYIHSLSVSHPATLS